MSALPWQLATTRVKAWFWQGVMLFALGYISSSNTRDVSLMFDAPSQPFPGHIQATYDHKFINNYEYILAAFRPKNYIEHLLGINTAYCSTLVALSTIVKGRYFIFTILTNQIVNLTKDIMHRVWPTFGGNSLTLVGTRTQMAQNTYSIGGAYPFRFIESTFLLGWYGVAENLGRQRASFWYKLYNCQVITVNLSRWLSLQHNLIVEIELCTFTHCTTCWPSRSCSSTGVVVDESSSDSN